MVVAVFVSRGWPGSSALSAQLRLAQPPHEHVVTPAAFSAAHAPVYATVDLHLEGRFAVLRESVPVWIEGPRAWKTVPPQLRGVRFLQNNNEYRGVTHFTVRKPGRLLMACTKRWGGGGNKRGGWTQQLVSREQIINDGWNPVDGQLVSHLPGHPTDTALHWELFERNCRAGETFKYRTEKYAAPILLMRNAVTDAPSQG